MPKQRIGIVLLALAAVTASIDQVIMTVILAVLGAILIDE